MGLQAYARLPLIGTGLRQGYPAPILTATAKWCTLAGSRRQAFLIRPTMNRRTIAPTVAVTTEPIRPPALMPSRPKM